MRSRRALTVVLAFVAPLLLVDVAQAYYTPGLGRFINRDPYFELGGENLYAFVGNHPTLSLDPFGLQESDCAGKIDVKPMTLEELWKEYPKSAETLKGIGIDITDKGLLGQTTLARCVTLPPEKGGGLFCFYEFGYKFKGKCGCGNSIIQQVTNIKKWLKGGATVKEEKKAFVEAFESKDDWSVIIDHHFHGGAIDSKVADQRCVWTKVVFCCGKFGDKSAPSKYEKYGDESDKVNCAGPKSELTINFCFDLKGGTTFEPPEPFRPKATQPSPGGAP
jgi:hypothetical protein